MAPTPVIARFFRKRAWFVEARTGFRARLPAGTAGRGLSPRKAPGARALPPRACAPGMRLTPRLRGRDPPRRLARLTGGRGRAKGLLGKHPIDAEARPGPLISASVYALT